MKKPALFVVVVVAGILVTATPSCTPVAGEGEGEGEGEGGEGEGEEGEGEGEGGEGEGEGEGGEGEGEAPGTDGWLELAAYPCGFNRTDAFHVDADNTLWAGCGSNTEGQGLFVSEDGGLSWANFEPANAANFFDDFRVFTISRSQDGVLYVGGTGNNQMVVGINAANELESVLATRPQVGFTFTVGHFRRAADGVALATSATGNDALARSADGEAFVDVSRALFSDGLTHQVHDLLLDGGDFHGVGSKINEPNLYFAPATPAADEIVAFDVVDLSGTGIGAFDGELRAVAVAGDTVIAGGLDEGADAALFYVIDAATGDDERFVVEDIVTDLRASTVRGACAVPGHFVVVGEETLAGGGEAFVLHSTDAVAWEAITMDDNPGLLSKCAIVGDALFVAGGGGYIARFDF